LFPPHCHGTALIPFTTLFRSDRGVPAVPGRAARAADRRGHRLPGVLLPDRHDPPRPGPGRRDRGGADRLRRARRWGEQDVLRHRGRSAGEGDVLGTLTSRPGPSHDAALAWNDPMPPEGAPRGRLAALLPG